MEDKKLSAEEVERELSAVRLSEKDAARHGVGATYWNNAVTACQIAIRDALARHPQPECGDIAWIFEAVSAKVECNCPWNPDSHDKGCAVYLRDRLSDAQRLLAERDARIEALTEYAAAVEKSADKAEQERDQLRARVRELEAANGK